jgi:glyoxylase-like metal-dependent hydrolase (beta-lactamase superfamily II)
MELIKVSSRVYANTKGETGGNIGIILLRDSVAAVDAQYPVSGQDFRRSISSVTEKPVRYLLLTHSHGDHVFGNQAFEDCEIIAQRLLKERMEASLEAEWSPKGLEKMLEDFRKNRPEVAPLLEGLRIVLPTKTFEEHHYLGEGVELLHLPGHTADSSVVYVGDDETLFSGDLIFAGQFPWGGDPTADPDRWIDSLRKILAMDVDTIVPGHGPICNKEEIEKYLEFFEGVRRKMRRLIVEGASVEDAVEYDGYPSFYPPRRPQWLGDTLRNWYQVWKNRG